MIDFAAVAARMAFGWAFYDSFVTLKQKPM